MDDEEKRFVSSIAGSARDEELKMTTNLDSEAHADSRIARARLLAQVLRRKCSRLTEIFASLMLEGLGRTGVLKARSHRSDRQRLEQCEVCHCQGDAEHHPPAHSAQ